MVTTGDTPATRTVGRTVGRTVTVLLYEGFEVLDVFGPVEILAHVPGWTVEYAGVSVQAGDPVRSAQGAQVQADLGITALRRRPEGTDVLLVPGGIGSRALVTDSGVLADIAGICRHATVVASVCTGSALLAAAGVLDGRRATSNKKSWDWVTSQGRRVDWVPQARWVVDDSTDVPVWTSSGVAAGMDMAHALVAALAGASIADEIADNIEVEVHRDPAWDPFSAMHGLS
jgi:transcriptional regulator GlxA family with amidase domain